MYRVTFDYKTKNGFLETDTIKYDNLKLAFAFLRVLSLRRDVVGKPILEMI